MGSYEFSDRWWEIPLIDDRIFYADKIALCPSCMCFHRYDSENSGKQWFREISSMAEYMRMLRGGCFRKVGTEDRVAEIQNDPLWKGIWRSIGTLRPIKEFIVKECNVPKRFQVSEMDDRDRHSCYEEMRLRIDLCNWELQKRLTAWEKEHERRVALGISDDDQLRKIRR